MVIRVSLKSIFIILAALYNVQAEQAAILRLQIVDLNGDKITKAVITLKTDKETVHKERLAGQKQIVLNDLRKGGYLLEVEAEGFRKLSRKIKIDTGINELIVILEIEGIIENVDIERDSQEKSIDNAFSGFYTREQIDALPETGEEIKRVLKDRYGPDVIIRVDGFSGRIPPKSRIASIRATLSSYDAENHKLGLTFVDITTKVYNQSFTGSAGFNFNDESLNARNPFSPSRLPEQDKNIDLLLFGPLVKSKSSFHLWFIGTRDTQREKHNCDIARRSCKQFGRHRKKGDFLFSEG